MKWGDGGPHLKTHSLCITSRTGLWGGEGEKESKPVWLLSNKCTDLFLPLHPPFTTPFTTTMTLAQRKV